MLFFKIQGHSFNERRKRNFRNRNFSQTNTNNYNQRVNMTQRPQNVQFRKNIQPKLTLKQIQILKWTDQKQIKHKIVNLPTMHIQDISKIILRNLRIVPIPVPKELISYVNDQNKKFGFRWSSRSQSLPKPISSSVQSSGIFHTISPLITVICKNL